MNQPPTKKPKIGDTKDADGRKYIFLQTTGKPDWHSPEEVEEYRNAIDERRNKLKLSHAGIKPKKSKKPGLDPDNLLEEQEDDAGLSDKLTQLVMQEKHIQDGAPEEQEETPLVDEDPKPKQTTT